MHKSFAGMMLAILSTSMPFGGCLSPAFSGTDLVARVEVVSPYVVAGKDARFEVTVHSESGLGLHPALLDPSCLRIRLEGGEVLQPPGEGLSTRTIHLGTQASLSRVVDLSDTLEGLKTQTVEVVWNWGGIESEITAVRIYEWDLKEIEAVIETDQGPMTAEFFPDKAPITVMNFVDLSLRGFYDNLTFHRIIPDFMIQGGCPNGDGTGDPGYFIKGEFTDLSHLRGTLSMARTDDPDSAGCQFFIMHGDNPQLDGLYAAFGRLTSGYETLDRLAGIPLTAQRYGDEISRPVEPPRIKSVAIRRKSMKAGTE